MLKAVIFDMDGVIIDSEPMHAKAAVLALKKFNTLVDEAYVRQFIGSTVSHMCKKMIEDFHINATPQELIDANNEMKDHLKVNEGYQVIPFVKDLMKNLYLNGIKLIIASSSDSKAIEDVMETFQIKDYFEGYVSGSMVKHPKPSPEIFLLAAEKLGVLPAECLVIEDSYNGVSAAHSAKMTCMGFVNPNSGNQDLRKAAILVEGFDEIDYHFINKIYQYDHMEPVTITTTDNFIIRELSIADIDQLYKICQTPSVREYLDDFNDGLELEKEKHLAYIKNIYHFYGFGIWGVYRKDNSQLIGRCGIEYKSLDGEDVYELGYLLDPEYQGKGYAKEFVSEVLHYCFTELDIHRIISMIDITNHRSIHLAEQVGMHRIGECNKNHRKCYLYEITFHS